MQLIARTGDPLEVAPGDFRTISGLAIPNSGTSTGNSDGRPSGFNNLGQLAFAAGFTDGTGGVFVSNRVAVPEPSTLALVAVSLGAFVLRRHRNAHKNNINDARFNRLAPISIVLALAVIATLSDGATTAHAVTVRTVALSGQQAPGAPDGVNYGSFHVRPPVLNDAGQTAFFAKLTGDGVSIYDQGIWSEGSGSLALVARHGSQAAGMPDGFTFNLTITNRVVINNAGQTAFRSYFYAPGVSGQGIWSEGSGSLALVARSGSQAPGMPDGVNYSSFNASFALNDAGQTAFSAALTGTSNNSSYGIWSDRSGSLALVVRIGDHAPGTPSGVNFSNVDDQSSSLVLNNAGQTAFKASLAFGGGVDFSNEQGIWSEGFGSLALVAREGSQAPGTPDGVNFGFDDPNTFSPFSSLPALNDAGQTAFFAELTGSGVDSTNNLGIWSDRSGSLALVVRTGDHAPGMPIGVNYSGFGNNSAKPALNDAGEIAFRATLTDGSSGIWLEDSGSLAPVALSGQQAPGTPSGVNFGDVGSNFVLNDAGQTAFFATLTGTGVVAGTNSEGVWATDPTGAFQLIARTGDPLEVAPGDFRTIQNLMTAGSISSGGFDGIYAANYGRPRGLNNLGQLAFRAGFTDGSSGIFVSNRVAIPEPSTLLLLCFGSLAVLWRRRGLLCAAILTVAVGITFADRAAADTFGGGANTFDIEFVTIGNPGNAADTDDGDNQRPEIQQFGLVNKAYRIGKFEVSRDMVIKSSNAAGLAISLWDMTNFGGNGVDRPATGVSWSEAARFVNWLNTSSGSAPAYKFAVQPGEVGYNANANIELWAIGDAGYNSDNLYRNTLARYFLPSIDEWYKAAYYDPSANGGGGGYWNYPTGSDSAPTPVASGTSTGTAVYFQPSNQGPADITQAGGLNPYGIMAMGGNVYEWEETARDLMNNSSSFARGIRGGYWVNDASDLVPPNHGNFGPSQEIRFIGFRVASIPEPSTLLLLCFGSLAVLWRRRGLLCVSILAAAVGMSFADRAVADTFGSGANTFDVEFVTIGNPGNAADDISANPDFAGSVPYTYRLGKFEISEQMIDKANAEGGLSITKNTRGPDKPATSTSWNEAARFVNWLNTSTGSTPAYKFAIQPGEVGYNANANIELWTISDTGYNPNNLYRNSQARYFLPSVDEWYKAAYYDPTTGVYYDYPTGSNIAPTAVASGTAPGTAVFGNTGPADITLAGGLSPYGTMGQGGNVYEWEETESDLVNNLASSARGLRSGGWIGLPGDLQSSFRTLSNPTVETSIRGFRVASIPEPSTLLLLGMGIVGASGRRRRMRI